MITSLPQRRTYLFGEFELQIAARMLVREGKRVPMGSKAFEVLTCLVSHAGELVTKEQLLKTVWPDAYVEESNLSQHVFALRKALGDRANLIVTVPGRGYQFTGTVREAKVEEDADEGEEELVIQTVRESARVVIEEPYTAPQAPAALPAPRAAGSGRRRMWAAGGLAAGMAIAGLVAWLAWARFDRAGPDEVHTLMVADFQNSTGDSTFDRTLKRALEIELGQSPSLNVMSASEAGGVLRRMDRPPETALTGDVAREVCVRGNRQMLLTGAIAGVGHAYLLTLEATDCQSGRKLASAKAQASSKEDVLGALDSIADRVRSKLGESSKSLQQYQVPIAEATTASLEALQAYSIGQALEAAGKDETEQIASYQRAVELDPKFAMAWGGMANAYYNLNEYDLASQTWQKAFDQSDHVSTREKLILRAHYYGEGLNDEVEAIKAYQLWAATYPRDWAPAVNICNDYTQLAQYAAAIEACQEGVRRQPERAVTYSVLTRALKDANRLEEAKAVGERAIAKAKDSTGLHSSLYEIALAQRDEAGLAREEKWAENHSDSWYRWYFPYMQGAAAGRNGRYKLALERFRQSYAIAQREKLTESARDVLLEEATIEFQLGFPAAARATLSRVPVPADDSDPAILLHAQMGDAAVVERVLAAHKAVPHPATMRAAFIDPLARAALALGRHRAQEALDDLEPATPHELSGYWVPSLRAAAYLQLKQIDQTEQEYRRILANPGVDPLSPMFPLARLGLARAYAAAGDKTAARGEYEQFLAAWKDADPDLPLLRAAQAELARLPKQ